MQVAIVGGGQLARMLALAGWPLGLRFAFLVNDGDDTRSVEGLGRVVKCEPGLEPSVLYEALGRPVVITVEKEAVDTGLLEQLNAFCPVHPRPDVLRVCQNRRRQKLWLESLGIAVARHRFAHDAESLWAAAGELGFPLIVKAAEQGYDGRNQWRLADPSALDRFVGQSATGDWVVEEQVPFLREISLLAVRSAQGEIRFYPPTENRHVNGVLRTSLAPAIDLPEPALQTACEKVRQMLERTQYVGVLALEYFVLEDRLCLNEVAPRVHNSGHWTQQGSTTSQFENHLRAILGWPLGACDAKGHAGMVNILGTDAPPDALLSAAVTLHLYDKQKRPGRKLGHVNVRDDDRAKVEAELQRLEQRLGGG